MLKAKVVWGSSKRVTSVGRLQHHLALEHPHQHSTTAAMTVHHDSYSPLATPVVRSGDTIYSFHRGQNECNRDIALFACSVLESCDTSLSEPHDHTFVLA